MVNCVSRFTHSCGEFKTNIFKNLTIHAVPTIERCGRVRSAYRMNVILLLCVKTAYQPMSVRNVVCCVGRVEIQIEI